MSLLDKLQGQIKGSTANIETVPVEVRAVVGYKDPKKLMITTDKGTFFVFKDSIRGISNPDALPQKFKAELTLVEKGEYVNVTAMNIELESLGKYNFVASAGISVNL
jgi:hypothetical protein